MINLFCDKVMPGRVIVVVSTWLGFSIFSTLPKPQWTPSTIVVGKYWLERYGGKIMKLFANSLFILISQAWMTSRPRLMHLVRKGILKRYWWCVSYYICLKEAKFIWSEICQGFGWSSSVFWFQRGRCLFAGIGDGDFSKVWRSIVQNRFKNLGIHIAVCDAWSVFEDSGLCGQLSWYLHSQEL